VGNRLNIRAVMVMTESIVYLLSVFLLYILMMIHSQ